MTTNLNTLTAEDRAVARLTGGDLQRLAEHKARNPTQAAPKDDGRAFGVRANELAKAAEGMPLLDKAVAALVGEKPSPEDRARALEALGFKAEPKTAADVAKQLGAEGYGLDPSMTPEQIKAQLKRIGIKLAPREPPPDALLTQADRDVCKLTGNSLGDVARFKATQARARP